MYRALVHIRNGVYVLSASRHLTKGSDTLFLLYQPDNILTSKKYLQMTDVKIFNSPAFGGFRAMRNEKGEPLFCLNDVCDALGLKVSFTLARLELTPYTLGVADSIGRNHNVFFIQEKDFYRVIFPSRRPSCREFQDWVFDKILPSLRKDSKRANAQASQPTPSYEIEDPIKRAERWIEEQKQLRIAHTLKQPQAASHKPQIEPKAVANKLKEEPKTATTEQKKAMDEPKDKTNDIQQKPVKTAEQKVERYGNVLNSDGYMITTEIAKELNMSARSLNAKLNDAGIIFKRSKRWHVKASYLPLHIAKTRIFSYPSKDGISTGARPYLVWNQKGKELILALARNNYNDKSPEVAKLRRELRQAVKDASKLKSKSKQPSTPVHEQSLQFA